MPLHIAVASLQRSSSNAAGRSAPRLQSFMVRPVSRHPPLLAFTADNPFTSQQKAFVDAYAQVQDWTQHVRRVVGGRTPEQEERRQVVFKLYGSLDREMYDQLLDSDFRVVSEGQFPKALPREMWVTCLSDMVLPSLPNFSWMPESDGEVDTEGFCTVSVQATGTHNGAPFVLPGLPPVSPSGRTVQLVRESHRVKVENGKVKEIRIFPRRGAGPGALYEALGGVLPAPSRARQQA